MHHALFTYVGRVLVTFGVEFLLTIFRVAVFAVAFILLLARVDGLIAFALAVLILVAFLLVLTFFVLVLGAVLVTLFRWGIGRSEEHTSELQSLMRISYAVFCLTKNITTIIH